MPEINFDGPQRIAQRMAEIQSRMDSVLGTASTSSPSASGASSAPPADFANQFAKAVSAAASTPPAAPGGGGPISLRDVPPPPGWDGPTGASPSASTSTAGIGAYEPLIQKYGQQYGVSPDLVRAVMRAESDGNPREVSKAGAMGLMQLMPENCAEAGVRDPFDPDQNVRAGVLQLREHLDRYNGNVPLALAAYNAGPGNVAKYGGIPPFHETQNYVRKIVGWLGGSR